MEQLMQVCVQWTSFLVPALAMWAIIGINLYRSSNIRPAVDTLYFLAMIVIGVLTWRTMVNDDWYWLIHTASLGSMIVFGVLPRREAFEETVNWVQ